MPYLFLISVLLPCVKSYTITDVDPILPTEIILNDHTFCRTIPYKTPLLITCPPDTFLNKNTSTCDFIQNKEVKSDSNTLGNTCQSGGGTVQIADNCRNYLLCGPSGSYVMNCPGLLLFNEAIGVCDFPQNSQCCEFMEKNSEKYFQDL
ncbi:uncharacterized protein [Leptinotarsa decemlineata]|uniref:uncharacterized protein n=1 Tax=Leptinotarsa decemlineata TaxID=7539 RepID=UPI003D30D5CD